MTGTNDNRTELNKYGTRSVEVVYLLRNKIKCGYCGSPISAECGTAKNGQKIRYYKCLGRKHQSGCKKAQARKEILEKYVLDNDRVISAENVQRMGEVIALRAIKTVIVRGGKNLHNLYKGLLRDINRSNDDMGRFSDGYDIAQETMLFLCQNMGKRLDDVYVTKTGRKITIKQACFSVADRYLAKNFVSPMLNTISLKEQIATKPEQYSTTSKRTIMPLLTGLYLK